ncbi:MAG: hypothetical protein WDZ40_02645 [Candidatus Spechtbacterales bacterium]
MRKLVYTICFSLLISACSLSVKSVPLSTTTESPDTTTTEEVENLVIEGTPEQKAVIISSIITDESEGLLKVVRADVPLHGQTSAGYDYYGAHYRVVVLDSVHNLSLEQVQEINYLVAKIFELTTKEILEDSTNITHMGVQVLYPEIWSLGFAGTDSADPSAVYVASRRDLLEVLRSNLTTTEKFLSVAQKEKVFIIRESQLQE